VWAVLLVAVGILFAQASDVAVQVLGAFAALTASVVVAVRLVRYHRRFGRAHDVRWPWVAGGVALFVLLLLLLARIEILVTPMNALLGTALLVAAGVSTTEGLRFLRPGRPRRVRGVLQLTSAAVGALLGVVALTTVDRVLPFFVLQVGLYFIVVGLIETFFVLHDHVRRTSTDAAAHLLRPASTPAELVPGGDADIGADADTGADGQAAHK